MCFNSVPQEAIPTWKVSLSAGEISPLVLTFTLDFITGFPGHEHELRRALLEVLGQEKYDYFFERFLAYFFTAEDAKFLKSLGLNCVRIPINHRYLMDDLNPDNIKQDGFKLIDTIVDVCAAEGLYTIIDLHTFPGGQSM
jgi:hypothetical protein